MKLATVNTPTGHRLIVQTPKGLLDVARAATEQGSNALAKVTDVGDLLRTPDGGLDLVRGLSETSNGPYLDESSFTFCPPVLAPEKILCIGLNYALHAEEGKVDLPEQPLLFGKYANALAGHGDAVRIPSMTSQLDWEGELALVIGRRGFAIAPERALEYVAGYTIVNDLTARDVQSADGQWTRSKTMDGFAPIGPWMLTADEVPDPAALTIETRVNGDVRQHCSCEAMVHSVATLVSFVSQGITLEPGDIICTGTPPGVGLGMDPPQYLNDGDVVEVEIGRIGVLRTSIVA